MEMELLQHANLLTPQLEVGFEQRPPHRFDQRFSSSVHRKMGSQSHEVEGLEQPGLENGSNGLCGLCWPDFPPNGNGNGLQPNSNGFPPRMWLMWELIVTSGGSLHEG